MIHGRSIPTLNDKCDWIHQYIYDFKVVNLGGLVELPQGKSYAIPCQMSDGPIFHVDAACDVNNVIHGFGVVAQHCDDNLF